MSPDQIKVDSFMLADAAKTFDGKLYLHGGGWNFLNILERDAARPISLVGRVIIPWDVTERELKFAFSLEHSDASTVLEHAPIVQMVFHPERRPEQPKSLETATPFVIDIPGVVFLHPGEYAFVINHEGEELARTRFQVNFVSPDTTATSAKEED